MCVELANVFSISHLVDRSEVELIYTLAQQVKKTFVGLSVTDLRNGMRYLWRAPRIWLFPAYTFFFRGIWLIVEFASKWRSFGPLKNLVSW